MSDDVASSFSNREKLDALSKVAAHRKVLSASVVVLSLVAALLEGLGISFIIPIVDLAQQGTGATDSSSQIDRLLIEAFDFLGIPFTLQWVILAVVVVMAARFSASFVVGWLREKIRTEYLRDLQISAFENALDAKTEYFDESGSDDILNAIITQSAYAGNVIQWFIQVVEQTLLSVMYVGVALYLAPRLTVATAVVMGGLIYLVRSRFESGFEVGDRRAEANERIQQSVQAGTQGIRDVKLFGMRHRIFDQFRVAIDQFADATIKLRRNQVAISNFTEFLTAVTVFALIYFALTFTSMSLGSLGVYLFAMFRLAPRISLLNNLVYQVEGDLPYLVRTQRFIGELSRNHERNEPTTDVPEHVETVAFENVSFGYGDEGPVLDDLSFEVSHGEFVAFVGPSGAGKSTIVSLLTRMYNPDAGVITADGVPIDQFDVHDWRSRVSVVRQNPYMFNDTLRYNIAIGKPDATAEEIERVAEIAQVTEFLDELPNGYDTVLGDDGVRLSGGQRQRVSIARALLKDGDLLVLDEATSNLDTTLEKKVHEGIERMARNYAVVVIAHRLSTVTGADRIYAVRGGHIVENGRHDDLLAGNGTYAELYAAQSWDRPAAGSTPDRSTLDRSTPLNRNEIA